MKITISTLCKAKTEGRKFSAVSCYDYTSAKLAVAAGIDVLLIGDSAVQFMLGFDSTLPATMDFMIAITAAVNRAAFEKLIIADLPYESCCAGAEQMIRDSRRFIEEAGADVVKIETSAEQFDEIKAVINAGIPVMPHLGIRPQTGKYKAEGITAEIAAELINFARQVYNSGAQMLLLEGTAREVGKIIAQKLPIPVISCGAGPDCDGQVLVLPDILKLRDGAIPKFSKSFADIGKACTDALAEYDRQIKQNIFPDDQHSYHMKAGEFEKLQRLIG
jgi:3-methyl-2-oxobutanoate hydroxymethyltransferase